MNPVQNLINAGQEQIAARPAADRQIVADAELNQFPVLLPAFDPIQKIELAGHDGIRRTRAINRKSSPIHDLTQLRQLNLDNFFSAGGMGVAASGRGFVVTNPNVVKTKLLSRLW
jgi:hypothetical protein